MTLAVVTVGAGSAAAEVDGRQPEGKWTGSGETARRLMIATLPVARPSVTSHRPVGLSTVTITLDGLPVDRGSPSLRRRR